MIRRNEGSGYNLYQQIDHARLAAGLAERFDEGLIGESDDRPGRRADVIEAIAGHDDGWARADEQPGINARGEPLDYWEVARPVLYDIWMRSCRGAAGRSTYAALLVALHHFDLSAEVLSASQPARFDVQQLRQQFDLNKLQHALVEHLEALRVKLNLPVDRPLLRGQAAGWTSPAEDRIAADLNLLRIADKLSLFACGAAVLSSSALHFRSIGTAAEVPVRIIRATDGRVAVTPWLFQDPSITLSFPCRSVPRRRYDSDKQLQEALSAAGPEEITVVFLAG